MNLVTALQNVIENFRPTKERHRASENPIPANAGRRDGKPHRAYVFLRRPLDFYLGFRRYAARSSRPEMRPVNARAALRARINRIRIAVSVTPS
jgi:hypothetical protein